MYQAHAVRLFGIEPIANGDQRARSTDTNAGGEQRCALPEIGHVQVEFRNKELRGFGREANIRGKCDRYPSADTIAVRRHNHGET